MKGFEGIFSFPDPVLGISLLSPCSRLELRMTDGQHRQVLGPRVPKGTEMAKGTPELVAERLTGFHRDPCFLKSPPSGPNPQCSQEHLHLLREGGLQLWAQLSSPVCAASPKLFENMSWPVTEVCSAPHASR